MNEHDLTLASLVAIAERDLAATPARELKKLRKKARALVRRDLQRRAFLGEKRTLVARAEG